jgi:hypothetical protein
LIKILVITPCYGHVWALTEILKAEGYDAYGIVIGNIELETEDMEDNLYSAQPEIEVIELIEIINPNIILIINSFEQRYFGLNIAYELPQYQYVTLSFGTLLPFPCEETSLITNADFSIFGRKLWLEQLKQFIGD